MKMFLTILISLFFVANVDAQILRRVGKCGNPYCEMCYGSRAKYIAPRVDEPLVLPKEYNGTPATIIKSALNYVKVNEGDIVFDLGCGDGRWLIEAAKRGAIAYGYETNKQLYSLAKNETAKYRNNIDVANIDLLKADLSTATVIVLYQTNDVLEKLLPNLLKLRSNVKIISYQHQLPGMMHDDFLKNNIFVYQTPLKELPTWVSAN